MRPCIAFMFLTLIAVAPAIADDPHQIVVEGDPGQRHVLVCKAGDRVIVTGDEHALRISGPCKALELTGSEIRVDIDSVATITIKGDHNSVTWHQSPNRGGPRVEEAGENNQVARAGRHKQPAP